MDIFVGTKNGLSSG